MYRIIEARDHNLLPTSWMMGDVVALAHEGMPFGAKQYPIAFDVQIADFVDRDNAPDQIIEVVSDDHN